MINWLSIDIPICPLLFGDTNSEGTCNSEASVPCFNSLATCTSVPDYSASTKRTVQAFFTDSTTELEMPVSNIYGKSIPIPNIQSVSLTPAKIEIAEGLGARATLTVTFADHPTSDLQDYEDPYVHQRSYDPWKRGTFWAKFMARHKFLRGQVVRWAVVDPENISFEGFPDDHQIFVVDRFEISNGTTRLIAKDPLSIIDDKRAIAPALSRGQISAGINSSTTSATLAPSGIGNADYPASGVIAIGGEEICNFTRSGDSLTLTRGQFNTSGVAHDAEDRVQLCVRYDGEDPADILYDLLTTYGRFPADYINLPDWKAQTNDLVTGQIQRLYSAVIADPEPVKTLVEELLVQTGITLWWDGRSLRLRVLGNISVSDLVRSDNVMADTVSIKDQPEKRVSQLWLYFGKVNPLEGNDDPANYAVCQVTAQAELEQLEEAYRGQPAIRTIYARWISRTQRAAALRLNELILARYSKSPREVSYSILIDESRIFPGFMQGVSFESFQTQDSTGEVKPFPAQITSVQRSPGMARITAEEFMGQVAEIDPTNKVIFISANTINYNLREDFTSQFSEATDGDVITCIIESGIIIGSASTSLPAFDVGTGWPEADYSIRIFNFGTIVGRGGRGGEVIGAFRGSETFFPTSWASNGGPGGLAFKAGLTIQLTNSGTIGGGGGGGGGAVAHETREIILIGTFYTCAACSGSGGAGLSLASAGKAANRVPNRNNIREDVGIGNAPTTLSSPGQSRTRRASFDFSGLGRVESRATGGAGGGLGQNGSPGAGTTNGEGASKPIPDYIRIGSGGPPGPAIDGISNITLINTGSILGSQIN